jgi:hypothetical protein
MNYDDACSMMNLALIYADQKVLTAYRKMKQHAERQEFIANNAMEIVRRYQRERDCMIDRITAMAHGAYNAWRDQMIVNLPKEVAIVIIGNYETGCKYQAFLSRYEAREYCLNDLDHDVKWTIIPVPMDWSGLKTLSNG